jgi:hypothetical protein
LYLDSQINDKCNDVYGLVYALSTFVSPLAGSALYNMFGPRLTCDYVAIMNIITFLILFIFNCGPFVYRENREFLAKLAKLKQQSV